MELLIGKNSILLQGVRIGCEPFLPLTCVNLSLFPMKLLNKPKKIKNLFSKESEFSTVPSLFLPTILFWSTARWILTVIWVNAWLCKLDSAISTTDKFVEYHLLHLIRWKLVQWWWTCWIEVVIGKVTLGRIVFSSVICIAEDSNLLRLQYGPRSLWENKFKTVVFKSITWLQNCTSMKKWIKWEFFTDE